MDINEVIKRIQNINNLNPQELQTLQANNPRYNMAGNSGEMTDAAMAQAKQELNFLKAMGQNRILDDDEKARALYLQDLTAPVELLPVDIDGASAGNPLSKQKLNEILERIYQMKGVK